MIPSSSRLNSAIDVEFLISRVSEFHSKKKYAGNMCLKTGQFYLCFVRTDAHF